MNKLLAGMLVLCLLLALCACGNIGVNLSEADQTTGTYPDGMVELPPYTEPVPEIDFGDIDFEDAPTDGHPMEDI